MNDDYDDSIMARIVKQNRLIRAAQALIGEELGDDWGRIAHRVLWHDPYAVARDLADAMMESRELRDRGKV
jgi:hypothetical protein